MSNYYEEYEIPLLMNDTQQQESINIDRRFKFYLKMYFKVKL